MTSGQGKVLPILILLMVLSVNLYGQRLQVRSYVEPSTIGRDEEVTYTIQVTGSKGFKANAPKLPELKDFYYRSLMTSLSSSYSIVNGAMHESVTRSFIYRLMPRRTGNLVIPSFNINIEGQVYATQQNDVRVLDMPRAGSSQTQPGSPSGRSGRSPMYMPDPFDLGFEPVGDVDVVAIPEKSSVYLGESFLVTYRLNTTQPISSLEIKSEKDFGGYGKELYSEPNRLEFETISYKNQRYKSAVIKVLAISPNRAGTIILPQVSAEIQLGNMGLYSSTLQNENVSITVKELPQNGKPENYSGAVGSFKVNDSALQKPIRLGEAYEYKLVITGRGNFNQFSIPYFPQLQDFRIASPMTDNQIRAGIEGTRTITYVLIPQKEGRFTVPGVSFNWFDPVSGTYRSFTGRPKVIEVKPGNVLTFLSNVFQKEQLKTMSPLTPLASYKSGLLLMNSLLYWILIALILLSVIPSWIVAKSKQLKESDPELAAQKSSTKVLKKYMKQAEDAAKFGTSEFYPKAEQGLMRYLSDKYHVPQRYSNQEKIYQLRLKGLNEDMIQQLEMFLKRCTEVRFMPGGFNADTLLDDLDTLKQLIRFIVRRG